MTDRKAARRRPHLSLVGGADEPQRGVGRFRSRDSDALQPGAVCAGRYRIMRRIAEGGMAEIYEAYDMQTNGLVALKTLQLQHRHNRAVALRSSEEARTLLRIRHPHLVRVTDAGVDDGTLYFCMDLLRGCDLRHLLVFHGALPLRVAMDLVLQLAKGVQALHDQGVIHRDLKPENVFVHRLDSGRLHVTLLDLGAAKLDYRNHVTTAVGATPGTAQYMSPEQASGETAIGPKSDVYALGLILLELILGTHLAKLGERPPLTLGDWTDWQRSYPKPDLRPHLPDAHPDVILLLSGCIERLSRRVPDAVTLADILAALHVRLGPVDLDAAYRAIELPEVTSLGAATPSANAAVSGQVKVAVDSHVTPRTPYARTEEKRASVVVADDERDTLRMAEAPRFDLHLEPPSPAVEPAHVSPVAPRAVAVARATRPPRRRPARRRIRTFVLAVAAIAVPLALVFGFLGAYFGARQSAAPGGTAIVVVTAPAEVPAATAAPAVDRRIEAKSQPSATGAATEDAAPSASASTSSSAPAAGAGAAVAPGSNDPATSQAPGRTTARPPSAPPPPQAPPAAASPKPAPAVDPWAREF